MGLLVAVFAIHMHAEVGEVEAFDACALSHLGDLGGIGAKGLEGGVELFAAAAIAPVEQKVCVLAKCADVRVDACVARVDKLFPLRFDRKSEAFKNGLGMGGAGRSKGPSVPLICEPCINLGDLRCRPRAGQGAATGDLDLLALC